MVLLCSESQVFVNCSTSDVVATTSVEALAMGKWVVAARHACNAFISGFANCLIYETPEQFNSAVRHALEHDPAPLSSAERHRLSWEDATERWVMRGSFF
jgi:digalactosyldiacylglycerol synthase